MQRPDFSLRSLADVMRVFDMTARALRFYEEEGLVVAGRNRFNARVYDATACRRLAWIAELRRGGVPLRDIAAVLEAEDRDGRGCARAKEKLQARRQFVLAQLARLDHSLAAIAEREGAGGSRNLAA
jgi:DNA-binding transcriptional MerR regulator